jgi:hypothetical protein
LTSKLLAPELTGVATPALDKPPYRVVYAVSPDVGSQPVIEPFLAAIRTQARKLGLTTEFSDDN